MESQRGNKIVNYIILFYISILFTLPSLCYKTTEKETKDNLKDAPQMLKAETGST
jgi:hypothetical protein